MMPERRPDRHWLVWLDPGAARQALPEANCRATPEFASKQLADWLSAGHPLIVARQDGTSERELRLGLALPPEMGKYRLAFRVRPEAIRRLEPPPALDAQALGALPESWRDWLTGALAHGELRAAEPRILGSAGMQVITGRDCVAPGSDLDLLLSPPDYPAARALCERLVTLSAQAPMPIDGEIHNVRGEAVAWRELAGGARRLLMKSIDGAWLGERRAFAAAFEHHERCTE